MITGTNELIDHIYAAFNARDLEGALAHMHEDVSWPKASEGGRAQGKQAIRDYWMRQWSEFDPHVDPVEVLEGKDDRIRVRVHQLVKDSQGTVLFDGEVWHVYTLAGGLVTRMDLGDDDHGAGAAPSEAFRH